MNINFRTTPPACKIIKTIKFPKTDKIVYPNNFSLHILESEYQELVKFTIILHAANEFNYEKPFISPTVAALLLKGSKSYSAEEISEKLDYYGYEITPFGDRDTLGIKCIGKPQYFSEVIKIIKDIISSPNFADDKLEKYKQKQIQTLAIENEQTDFVATKKLTTHLYGNNHPYGHETTKEDIQSITADDCKAFHKKTFHAEYAYSTISGCTHPDILEDIQHTFGNKPWQATKNTIAKKIFILEPSAEKKLYIAKEDAVQTSLRIGKLAPHFTNSDFGNNYIVNYILGGYFGSKLMTNLREDKGFTYGIHASINNNTYHSELIIQTQVAKEVREEASKEIYNELQKIRLYGIQADELEHVKNLYMAAIAARLDNAFSAIDILHSYPNSVEFLKYKLIIASIKRIQTHDIQNIANLYFHEDSFYEISVG